MPPRASAVAAPSTGTAVVYSEQTLHSLTWDLDIDTNDTSVDLRLPLQSSFGEVVLVVKVYAPQALEIRFDFGSWEYGALEGTITPRASLYWLDDNIDGSKRVLNFSFGHPATFDGMQSNYPSFSRLSQRRFRLILAFQSSTLIAASPYFKTMLESGVGVENVQRGGRKRLRSGVASRGASIKEAETMENESGAGAGKEKGKEDKETAADDSDEETDKILASTRSLMSEEMDDVGDFTYREIEITETAYSTYRAVLLYLVTSHIYFAILRSSLLPYNPAAEFTRKQIMETELEEEHLPSLPVSVKSVYGLADLLELPALKVLALDEFRTQLSVVNVARELFSSTSALYDEFRTAALDFAVEHWSEVKETEGMKEIERKGKAGEWQGSPALFFELMARAAK
ncbi:hypothetical protein BCR35DRAFT_355041 [Leucosporidium creatinivorum]|uniref:BTB domain-containing protein n=1 Tax=Leucosporidium creatinivorum TaxID=106004 RepID=A0A1Y2DWS9_9BASI|nr:hypothetical protein BCR35DRAFT_355041 [Leucosporidium creatinivorum]